MRLSWKLAWLIVALASSVHQLHAQDLRPRAYVITPVHWNAAIVGYNFNDGSVFFGSLLPISDASGQYHVSTLSYYHALNFFNRSANFAATLPYVVGNFQGEVKASSQEVYRSGMADSIYRFSVNLIGGPAMTPKEFVQWKQKSIVGASIQVLAPTGQYYSSHLVNPGNNRWAFKPELGISQRWHNWILDGYAGVWLFTKNSNYLAGSEFSQKQNTLAQSPIGSVEMHLSYDVKPRLWASIDGNYWYGGGTTVNGVTKIGSVQANSRIGGTISVPFTKHQSVKFSYSDGELARIGGTFKTAAVAWQYSWVGKPR